jgi:hypothetical protein
VWDAAGYAANSAPSGSIRVCVGDARVRSIGRAGDHLPSRRPSRSSPSEQAVRPSKVSVAPRVAVGPQRAVRATPRPRRCSCPDIPSIATSA